MRYSSGKRKAFVVVNTLFMLFVIAITTYPLLYMLATSFSSNSAVLNNRVTIYPVEITLDAYQKVMAQSGFWRGYGNTLLYTITGTATAMFMTVICAYPLSKKDLPGRGWFLKLMVVTMYFSGGLVPSYLLIQNLGLMNSIWAIILPGSISVYNMLIMRTFFINVPKGLEEAAMIDGLGQISILARVYLPLSKPILATITLFYAVWFWNDWFQALIYLTSSNKMPVTLFLRNLLMGAQLNARDGTLNTSGQVVAQTLQAATVVLTIVPILCVYPFVQKYFVRGVMLGSIKE